MDALIWRGHVGVEYPNLVRDVDAEWRNLNESSGDERANTVATHLQMGPLREEVVVVVVVVVGIAGALTLSLLPLPMPSVVTILLGEGWEWVRGGRAAITTCLLPLLHVIQMVVRGEH